jgi:hypothetical protein
MYKAKSIVDNKFWILESESGERVGTIKVDRDRTSVIIDGRESNFNNISQAADTLDLTFVKKVTPAKKSSSNEVYDFPTSTQPYNGLWNVQMRLPIYTKTNKSNSYHCAGYYIIRFGSGWVKSFCPKLITLQRYTFEGPFKSKTEMQERLRIANETA